MYLIINIISVIMLKQKLDDFAGELIKTAEISGRIGSEVETKKAKLKEELGISPIISITPSTGNVQLNNDIKVLVQDKADIGLSSLIKLTLNLKSSRTGQSEVYWK
jgi:hypothetical protein